MLKKTFAMLLIVAFACPLLWAESMTHKRQAKGQGANREEAIKLALADAVAQATGVRLSSQDYNLVFKSATLDVEKNKTGKSVELDVVSIQTGGTVLKMNLNGLVKTYEVVSEQALEDGRYEVVLDVWVHDYESIEQGSRDTLAIMPFKAMASSYQFGNLTISAAELTRKLSHELSVRLFETEKFAILDRDYTADFAQNRNLALSGNSSFEEQAKVGKVLGADYMLVGTLTQASLLVNAKEVKAIGRTSYKHELNFTFQYRLIAAPTRLIKMADTITLALKSSQIDQIIPPASPREVSDRDLVGYLVTHVANQIVEAIIERLYAVRIAHISETGEIVINQGGKRIPKGLILDVFSEGKELIDVDTQESLGYMESYVATIEVIRVAPKISYAKIIQGDLAKLTDGMVCRKPETMASPPKVEVGSESNVQRTKDGGVVLPFD